MKNTINNPSDNQEPLIDIWQVQELSSFMEWRESDKVVGSNNRFIMYIRKDNPELIIKWDQNGLFKQLTPNQQAIIKSYYNPESLDISFQDILNLRRTIFGDITKSYINLIISKYKENYWTDLSVEWNVEIFLQWILTAIEHNYVWPVPEHQTKFFNQKTDNVWSDMYLAAALRNVILHHQDNNLQQTISQDYLSYRQFADKIAAIFKTDKKDNSLDFARDEIMPGFINRHQDEVIPNLAVYTDDWWFVSNYYSKTFCEKCVQEVQKLKLSKWFKSVDQLKKEFTLALLSTIDDPIMNEYKKIIKWEVLGILLWIGMFNKTIEAWSQMLEENQDYKDFKSFMAGLELSEAFAKYVRVEAIHKWRGRPIEKRISINECCNTDQEKKINQYIKDFKLRKGL